MRLIFTMFNIKVNQARLWESMSWIDKNKNNSYFLYIADCVYRI